MKEALLGLKPTFVATALKWLVAFHPSGNALAITFPLLPPFSLEWNPLVFSN